MSTPATPPAGTAMPVSPAEAFTRFERAGWERAGGGYDRFFGPVTIQAADPLLDAAGVEEGSRVLDVGCGPGYVAARAAERGAEVTGVGLSPRLVALAAERVAGASFHVGDASDLPMPDAAYDAVVAGFLVPHLADHARAIAELARVTAPGGAVAVSTWDRPERVPLLGAFAAAVAAAGARPPAGLPPGPPFFTYSEPDMLAGLLRGAGLSSVRVTAQTFGHRVASVNALWDGVLAGTVRTSALVAGRTAVEQAAIRSALAAAVARYETRGQLCLPVSVLVASGRRPGIRA